MEEKENKGHGGSDHSHRHHHKHSRNKKTRFFRENKKALIGMGVSLVLSLVIIGLVVGFQMKKRPNDGENSNPDSRPQLQTQVQISDGMVGLAVPHFTESIPLADSWVKACVSDPDLTPATQILAPYRKEGLRLDTGLAATLDFEVTNLPEDCTVVSTRVLVSEDPNFGAVRNFNLNKDERSLKVYLLKADTTYYYKINVTLSDRSVVGIQSSFHTENLPRILSIDGIVNVRDIGGWVKADGKTIRQGLLYRGSEIDDAAQKGYKITDKGRQDMLSVLGIELDMDLRTAEVAGNGYTLGAGVTHKVYNAPMYVQIFQDYAKDEMNAIFTDLADINNYPVYLHCTHGLDRTGTVVFLLEAALGVSEQDLIREYELSALYFEKLNSDDLQDMIFRLNMLGGDSLQENAVLYLKSVGITDEQIEALRAIYLM